MPYMRTESPNGEIKIDIKDGFLFKNNSATLDKQAYQVLDQIFNLHVNNSDSLAIVIEGHSDDVGGAAYNKKLSLKRAQSVTDYLKTNYSDLKHVWTIGHGEEKPKVANDSDANRAKNRRVELLILDIEKAEQYINKN